MPYYDPATAETEEQHYLKVAADLVQRLAPAPTTVTADYTAKAARAERLLLGYLKATSGGVLSGKSLSGVTSKSFADAAGVRRIVAQSMGGYYTGGASSTVTVASSFTTV